MKLFSWFGSLSVRTQWIAILALWCVGITAATGIVAYRVTYSNAESEALIALQTDTSSVSAAVTSSMNHRRERMVATIQLIDTSCGMGGRQNPHCVSELLLDLVKKDSATGAVLVDRNGRRFAVGQNISLLCGDVAPCFANDENGQVTLELEHVDRESGLTLAAVYSTVHLANVVQQHWADHSGLFANVQSDIRTLAANGEAENVPPLELGECIHGDSAVRAADAKVQLYRAYSSVRGVEGVCVASAQSAAQVLASVRKLQSRLLNVGLLFIVCSILLAWLISYGTTGSIHRLRRRVAGFKADDKLRSHSAQGPLELRELSDAFDAMTRSLQKSQAELRQSEGRLALAYKAARLLVWEHDLDAGRISWRDPQSEAKSRASSLLAYVHMIHPDDRAGVMEALRRARENGMYSAEYRVAERGEYSWKYSWGQVLKAEASGREMLVGVTADASIQKEAERLRGDRARMAATTEMAASLAHEINNPLTSVTGALYMARREEVSPSLERYLSIAESESQRVVQIVRRLLQVYREPAEAANFDVVQLWRSMIAACEPQLKRRNQKVDLRANGPARVTGHVDELRHGFNNLLTNAMESSPAGGTIQIRVRQGTCWKQQVQGVRVLVNDEGPGIPQAELAKVFEPFVTTKAEKGTGLGLWVTRAAVVKQGGSIRIRSSVSKQVGTCVLMSLPEKPPS